MLFRATYVKRYAHRTADSTIAGSGFTLVEADSYADADRKLADITGTIDPRIEWDAAVADCVQLAAEGYTYEDFSFYRTAGPTAVRSGDYDLATIERHRRAWSQPSPEASHEDD